MGTCSLAAKPPSEAPATPPPSVEVGTVLCTAVAPSTGRPSDRCLLREQFLHKAIVLVLAESTDGKLTACVLNRPTSTIAQFKTASGTPKRRVGFTGNRQIGGLIWLHHRKFQNMLSADEKEHLVKCENTQLQYNLGFKGMSLFMFS